MADQGEKTNLEKGKEEIADLEEKIEEKRDAGEPITDNMVQCPSNTEWLKSMYSMLPPKIFRNSRLGKYEHCISE